jgi:hypothetical protein
MMPIWSPADVEKIRAALAYHPCVVGKLIDDEPEHTATVTDLAAWRRERGRR